MVGALGTKKTQRPRRGKHTNSGGGKRGGWIITLKNLQNQTENVMWGWASPKKTTWHRKKRTSSQQDGGVLPGEGEGQWNSEEKKVWGSLGCEFNKTTTGPLGRKNCSDECNMDSTAKAKWERRCKGRGGKSGG